jgi:hypothetical protein
MFAAYALLNLEWFRDVRGLADPVAFAQRLDRASLQGASTPRRAILEAAGASGTVVATEGPLLAWTLGLPTLALLGPPFAAQEWTEDAVRAELRRYRARVLVVNAPPPGFAAGPPSPFLAELLRGEVPAWLEVLAQTPDVIVLRPAVR